MPSCAVKGCKNGSWKRNGNRIRFFSFPKVERFNAEWRKVCNPDVSKHARICSEHFSPECYDEFLRHRLLTYYPTRTRLLKPDAVPTENLNLIDSTSIIDSTPKRRTNRSSKTKSENNKMPNVSNVRTGNSSTVTTKPALLPKNTPLYMLTNPAPIVNNNNSFFIITQGNSPHKLLPKAIQSKVVKSLHGVKHNKNEVNVIADKTNSLEILKEIESVTAESSHYKINKIDVLELHEDTKPVINKSIFRSEEIVYDIMPTKAVVSSKISDEFVSKTGDTSQNAKDTGTDITFDKLIHAEIRTSPDISDDSNDIIVDKSKVNTKILIATKEQYAENEVTTGPKVPLHYESQNNCTSDKFHVSDETLHYTNENSSSPHQTLTECESQINMPSELLCYQDQNNITLEESQLYCEINDTIVPDQDSQFCGIVNDIFIPETEETSEQFRVTDTDVLTIETQDLDSILKELQNCKDKIAALEEEVQKTKNENELLRARNEKLLSSCKTVTDFEQSKERSVERICNKFTGTETLVCGQKSKILVKQDSKNLTEGNFVVTDETTSTPPNTLYSSTFFDEVCNTVKDIDVNCPSDNTEDTVSNLKNETCSQSTNLLLTTPSPQRYILVVNSPNCTSYPVVGMESFKCDICSTPFISELSLAAHKMAAHEKKVTKCKICSFFTENLEDMKEHNSLHKAEMKERRRLNSCLVCKEYIPRLEMKKHLHTHPNLCITCLKVFLSVEECKEHKKSHDRDFLCDVCGKGLRTKGSLISHMTTHTPGVECNRFQCDLCSAVYRIESSLKRHKLWVHGNQKSSSCDVCGKVFPNRQSLRIHSKAHSNNRPYVCNHCGSAFKWSKNLTQHAKIHSKSGSTTERLECKVCSKSLATKSSLHIHMKRHARDPSEKIVCHLCGARLVDLFALKRHLVLHTDFKPFSCWYCSKSFTVKMSRDNHERSHTGDKPYQCVVCEKRFVSKGHLQEHSTIHSNERPFKCRYCDKDFRRRTHLNIHIRAHLGDRRYKCNFCPRRFIQRYDMKKHALTHNRKPIKIFVRLEQNVVEENVIEELIEDSI